ncbi:MAG TPA: thiopeptide-type bacteriocin biosynthesis protein, partial [Thermoanaerobaculia bacterium]|nr:thiopeptide-type bacteriocin biosynthesis protein [Thermoanaerobaculia bacterium]
MEDQLCLFTLLYAPREQHERILADFVTPIARDVRDAPELHSLFFARYNVPSWQVRFRILGRPDWVSGPVFERVDRDLVPLRESGAVEGVEYAQYDREVERYGGDLGMELAEKLFLHDSLACLDLMAAERQGLLAKTRREFSLLLTERLLDLLGFDREQRLAFYAYGHQWTREMGTWKEEEIATIEAKYQALKPGLQDLFTGEQSQDPETLWGGEEPARIAARWQEASRPVAREIRAAHDAGRISQDLGYLAWSYAHMSCNRLGIDPTP